MLLEHPSLDPFQPLIRELFDSTFGKALRGLAAAGLKPGDEWHTQAGFVFRAACLPVFGSTQQRVGAMVLDAERRIVVLEAEEAHAQSKKDSSIGEIKSLRSILQNRQLVLRRFMDGILWVLVWPTHGFSGGFEWMGELSESLQKHRAAPKWLQLTTRSEITHLV